MSEFMARKSDRVPLSEIVGRDALAAQVREILAEKSIVLTAERRMGKTYLLQKLWKEIENDQQNWISGWQCLYQDLSKWSTPLEFAQSVLDDAQELLGFRGQTLVQTTRFLRTFQDIKLGPLQLTKSAGLEWKRILISIFADLSQGLPGDQMLFLWDEFPVMLDAIIRAEGGETAASEILNLLRSLRAEYPRIRMILTGSVGLHHVMSKLRAGGYNNPVTNDMKVMSVPPLEMELAIEFAQTKLAAIPAIPAATRDLLAREIAQAVDGIPFYIKEVIDLCRNEQDPGAIDVPAIQEMIARALVNPDNNWHMAHYLERIRSYYGESQGELVEVMLDTVAEKGALSTQEIIQAVQSARQEPVTEPSIRDLLKLLERDHYLFKDAEDLKYRFCYSLIQRYWQCQRS
jgi:AAA+ ATPase superfamily predicted ATPase